MRRKKRKHNVLHVKQLQAISINKFKKQLLYYLKLLDCEDYGSMFEKKTIESIYNIRNSSYPKLIIDDGVVISTKNKREMLSDFDYFLSQERLTFDFTDKRVSLKGVFKYLFVINTYVQSIEENPDAKNARFIKSFRDKIIDFNDLLAEALKSIYDIMDFLGFWITRMDQSICWLESKVAKGSISNNVFIITLKEYIPSKKSIVIDNRVRPIFPLCLAFSNTGVKNVYVPSTKINKNEAYVNINIQVFFQNHLFHRLDERLDCIDYPQVQLSLFFNFMNPKIHEYNGKLLLEFRILDSLKLGYIVVEYIEGILLAKTFLLLTNSGTPEGEKLKENTGMEKYDLQYWAMDKLSTFQKSDIRQHAEIREVLEKSGCGGLFREMPLSLEEYHTKDKKIAKQIEQFIHK